MKHAFIALCLGAGVSSGCYEPPPPPPPPEPAVPQCPIPAPAPPRTPAEEERDRIFSWLALAVADKHWQVVGDPAPLNIAAILVNRHTREPVCWARNTARVTRKRTDHAEVRLLLNHLELHRNRNLLDHDLYSTLEPCTMCSGMIAMVGLHRVVFVNPGGAGGKALDVLGCHAEEMQVRTWRQRKVQAPIAPGPVPRGKKAEDEGFAERERAYFAHATQELKTYTPIHPENAAPLAAARRFLKQVPEHHVDIPYTVACPGEGATPPKARGSQPPSPRRTRPDAP